MPDPNGQDPKGNLGSIGGNPNPGLGGDQGDGSVEREWMKALPDDLRKSKSLSKFENIDALAKSYMEAESEIGKRVRIPGQEATAEDWGKFFSRIGRPDSPDGYEIPQGKLDKSLETFVRQQAFVSGLNKAQTKIFAEGLVTYMESSKAAQALAREQADRARQQALAETFGANLNTVVEKADKAFRGLFPLALQQKILQSDFRNDVEFIDALAQIADSMGEDKLVRGMTKTTKAPDPYAWMDEAYGPNKKG